LALGAPNFAQDDTSIFFSEIFLRNFPAIFSNEIFNELCPKQ